MKRFLLLLLLIAGCRSVPLARHAPAEEAVGRALAIVRQHGLPVRADSLRRHLSSFVLTRAAGPRENTGTALIWTSADARCFLVLPLDVDGETGSHLWAKCRTADPLEAQAILKGWAARFVPVGSRTLAEAGAPSRQIAISLAGSAVLTLAIPSEDGLWLPTIDIAAGTLP